MNTDEDLGDHVDDGLMPPGEETAHQIGSAPLLSKHGATPRLAHDRHTRKLSSVNSALPKGTAVSRSSVASGASRAWPMGRVTGITLFFSVIAITVGLFAWVVAGCGNETRGLVLGEVDTGIPLETIDAADVVLDAGCPLCDAAITLDGDTTTAAHGGDGGAPYIDTCPGNQVVIGYQGYVTTVVDGGDELVGSIQTFCGQLSMGGPAMDQVVTSPGATLSARGESPDTPWTQMCPADQTVIGFDGQSGLYVDRIAFTCAHWTATTTPNGIVLARDATDTAVAQGGDGGTAFQESCPAGQVARGSAIRAGFWIDSFALICTTPTL